MSKNSLSILYITKKQNAIVPLASILRHAFPKLTASQTASPEEIHNFKDLDIIIADDEFKIKTDLPFLGVVPIEKADEYAKQHLDFITENEVSSYAIARAVKDILERKKLTQELKEVSIKDELTGLYNQKFLLETLARETKKAIRYGYPLTLLYVGIDSLRKINSKYGHEIGDRVLVDFGLIATNSVREINTILHHHEHFDGNGYPDHMQGTHIPVASRIIHLAESWDAMITAQDYRTAFPLDQALNELKKGAGKEFDPELVAIFTGLIEN